MTRRHFLTTAATVVAATRNPVAARSTAAPSVMVLGAGLAGLYAARLLVAGGAEVTVVEARGRAGGRLHTRRDLPGRPEAGGEVAGGSYRRLKALVSELGLTAVAPAGGRDGQGLLLHVGGQTLTAEEWATRAEGLTENERKVPPAGLLGLYLRGANPLTSLSDWTSPARDALDRQSVASFVRSRGASPEAVRLMNIAPNCDSLDDASLLWALRDDYRRQQGGTEVFVVAEGSDAVPTAMARTLGDRLVLGTPVTSVDVRAKGLELRAGRRAFRADYVVCTLPPPALARVHFSPAFDAPLKHAVATLPATPITKMFLRVERPFWQQDGRPATMWTDTSLERVFSRRDDSGAIVGLTVWVDGANARALDARGPDAAGTWVLAELARLRPSTKGAVAVVGMASWGSDPFAGGAYAHYAPGHIMGLRPYLARPWGRVHFAGEHTGVEGAGMEAALESGERAAREILEKAS
jgi:monoamine oxidase